ncbi:MAG: ABC transporter permease [Firmicutes bacterium]|nr:ABC transporter permease [Bacillota bacterium]
MGAIYKKEMRAYFTTPIGYIFIASFFLISGAVFAFSTLQQASGDTSTYFYVMVFVFVILVPILTMKTFSEERRTRTEQMLLTSPVSLTEMVLAKYLASMTMVVVCLGVTSIYYIPISMYLGDYTNDLTALYFGQLIALFLIASAFVAVGILISSLTENQMVACVATIVVILLFLVIGLANSYIDSYAFRSVLSWFSVFTRFGNFVNGVFDFGAVVYYISLSVVMIFLTVRVYEKRRWG